MKEESVPHIQPKSGTIGQSPIRLFLRSPKMEVSALPPSWLARKMGLHIYSDLLLTKKVRTEMNFAAGLLLLVSVFEWLLWTLLFNGIYSSDIFNRRNPELALAAMTGLFFGFAVFWFERQMLTSSEKGRKRRVAMTFRFLYIVIAAFITSQTFELMLFHKPIQERARQEAIRANAAKLYQEVLEAENRARRANSIVQITTGTEQAALTAARAERQKEESRRNWLNSQLAKAETEENPLRVNQYNRLLRESQSRLDILWEKERLAEEAFSGRGHQVEAERSKIVQHATTQRERFHAWVGQLREAAATGKDLDDGKGWTYEVPKPLFFEKLFLLADLMTGRPAGWPGASPEVRNALRDQFGFYEPPICSDPVSSSQLASTVSPLQSAKLQDIDLDCERRRSSTIVLRISWVAGLGAAMLIPLLILIIKAVLLPEELGFYYSRSHQAELGDIEAQNMHRAAERLRNRTES